MLLEIVKGRAEAYPGGRRLASGERQKVMKRDGFGPVPAAVIAGQIAGHVANQLAPQAAPEAPPSTKGKKGKRRKRLGGVSI